MNIGCDQGANERRPSVPIVSLDCGNLPEGRLIDVSVDPGYINIDDSHRHSGEPLTAVRPNFFFERTFAR